MGQDVAKVLLKHKGLLAEASGERKQAPIPGSLGVNDDQRELRKIKAVPLPPPPRWTSLSITSMNMAGS